MKNIVRYVIPLILVIAIPILIFLQKKENDLQKFDRITQKVFEEFNPTGISVAIVKDGEIVYEKSLGYKNIDNMSFLNNQAIFNIASCSKAFTAAAIGKLVENGLLSWDEKVVDYIPEFKLADECITSSLTIKDILSHRTGLGTFYGDLLWYNTSYTNGEVINRMQFLPITKEFRSEFGYQNNMYMIAGKIVENVTGQDWETYIKENFFDPLEMNDSRTSSDKFDGTENIAFPHYNDTLIGIYYFLANKPAASIWSNTRDLANWATMFLNNGKWNGKQILSPETIKELTAAQTILSVSEERAESGIHFRNYALGWSTYDYNGRKIIEHNGGMPGYISKVALVPEENLAIIILNNGFDSYSNNTLFFSYVDVVTKQYTKDWASHYSEQQKSSEEKQRELKNKRDASKNSNVQASLPLEQYPGLYADEMYGNAEVKIENNELELTLIPAKKVFTSKMKHWANNTFRVDFKDPFLPYGLIHFEIDKSNQITGFKIDLPNSDFHFQNLNFKKVN